MKIQKNIPLPNGSNQGRPRNIPFDKLKEIGDSFLLKGDPKIKHKVYTSLRSYNNTKVVTPIEITIRTEKNGVRVWRIK